jgi:hypothetical protein
MTATTAICPKRRLSQNPDASSPLIALTPLAVRIGRSLGNNAFFVFIRDGADDVHQPWYTPESMFLADFCANLV